MSRVLFFIILSLPFSAQAQLTFIELEAMSISPEKLSGEFKQEKYISDLAITLSSTGLFSYHRGKNIHWKTLEPIQSELIMTPNTIINRQGDNELFRMDVNAASAIGLISELFFSIMTSDWQKLAAAFVISGENKDGVWVAELTPIDETIAQFSSRISLRGDHLLREITLYEKSGDYTAIHFDRLSQ